MKTILFVSLFCFFCSTAVSAQNRVQIISGDDHAALPFATVINQSKQHMWSADENGYVLIQADAGDSIFVTHIGYRHGGMRYNSDKHVIILYRDEKLMKEVKVIPCRSFQRVTVSNIDEGKDLSAADTLSADQKTAHKKNIPFGGIVDEYVDSLPPGKFAIRLNPHMENSILESFSFWLQKPWFHQAPSVAVRSPLLISFYEISDTGDLPAELITNVPLVYFPEKTGKQTLQIDSLHIRIPENGIYISFQWVTDEKYQWKTTYRNPAKDNTEKIMIHQGVPIDGAYSKEYDLAFFSFPDNRWFNTKLMGRKLPVGGSTQLLFGTIKLEAVLKFCTGK